MKIIEVYNMANLDNVVCECLVGIIPSHALIYVKHITCKEKVRPFCYIVLTNIVLTSNKITGHYIVLIDYKDKFEIFDPLGKYCFRDINIKRFVFANNCIINKKSYQSKKSISCAYYCLFYISLRSRGVKRHKTAMYFKKKLMNIV